MTPHKEYELDNKKKSTYQDKIAVEKGFFEEKR